MSDCTNSPFKPLARVLIALGEKRTDAVSKNYVIDIDLVDM